MEATVIRQSPRDYLDLESGPKMYPQFCQQLRKLHPKFILVKNPRAKKVPKQYIKIIGQPESKESEYEARWEIWKEVNEALKFVMSIFRPTQPPSYKGEFKEPGTYEIDLLNKAKMYAELQMGIAMAQQDPKDVIPKLDALDAKEEREEAYRKKVQMDKDIEDMHRSVTSGDLVDKAYNLDPKTKATNVGSDLNMRHYSLIMKKRREREIEREKERARSG